MYSSGLIAWMARFQKSVALLTTEAELTMISEVTRQALYLQCLLPDLHIMLEHPIKILNNNQGALTMINLAAPLFQGHMKHYDIKVTHIHNLVKKGTIVYNYCLTNQMPANALMKALRCF
jgi:hypothetical protein